MHFPRQIPTSSTRWCSSTWRSPFALDGQIDLPVLRDMRQHMVEKTDPCGDLRSPSPVKVERESDLCLRGLRASVAVLLILSSPWGFIPSKRPIPRQPCSKRLNELVVLLRGPDAHTQAPLQHRIARYVPDQDPPVKDAPEDFRGGPPQRFEQEEIRARWVRLSLPASPASAPRTRSRSLTIVSIHPFKNGQ